MDSEAQEMLVDRLVDHWTHTTEWGPDRVLRGVSLHPDAVATFESICFDQPSLFLDIVVKLAHRNQSNEVMMQVASLLGVLLDDPKDRDIIDRVGAIARVDLPFKKLLGWCLPSDRDSEQWA